MLQIEIHILKSDKEANCPPNHLSMTLSLRIIHINNNCWFVGFFSETLTEFSVYGLPDQDQAFEISAFPGFRAKREKTEVDSAHKSHLLKDMA